MSAVKVKPLTNGAPKIYLLEPRAREFWESVGIFPDSLDKSGTRAEHTRKSRRALSEAGIGNLRLLCQEGGVFHDQGADESQLVDAILASSHLDTLLHLREFMHRRVSVVEETFQARIPEATRKLFDADLQNLGTATEQLKAFTKAILLYRNDSESLKDIYYLKLARAGRTEHAFIAESGFPTDIAERIEKKSAQLARNIEQLKQSTPARYQGCHKLPNGMFVVSVIRGYAPTVKADFRTDQIYNLHHGFGHIVFSIQPKRNIVDVRCKSGRVATAIHHWLANALGVKLKPVIHEVYTEYEPKEIAKRFLGEYLPDKGIELTLMRFRRSALPAFSPLTVEIGAHQQSIRDDLAALRESNVIQLRNLLDIEQMHVSYDGQVAKVTTDSTPAGLVRLRFDNTDWDDRQDKFRDAFEEAFGLPLEAPIDPSKLGMGEEGVYSHLLTIRDESQVLPFQRKSYQKLSQKGLLTSRKEQVLVCENTNCERKGVAKKKAQVCQKCGNSLAPRTITRVEPALSEIKKSLATAINGPTIELGEKEKSFEKVEYYPLRFTDHGGSKHTVSVLISDSVSDSMRRKLERSSRALLIVRAGMPDKPIYLDDAGVGHVSLGYLLAASESQKNETEARERFHELIRNLQRDHQRRVLQSAQRSYMTLKDTLSSVKDYEFETDVFSLLRSLFPETHKLGRHGKPEPDGFCGLAITEDGSLRDGKLWTFSYDAKLAESGGPYPLESSEYRKMKDYIESFRGVKSLFNVSKRLKAHVLISNNIAPGRIKASAEYLQSDAGLTPNNRDVVLVYLNLGFLLRLHERVRDRHDDFQRRASFLAEAVAERMAKRNADGYVHLAEKEADELATAVLERDEVHPKIDLDKLTKELDA